jgi:hypothetical protein
VARSALKIKHDDAFRRAESFAAVAGFFVADFRTSSRILQQCGDTESRQCRTANSQDCSARISVAGVFAISSGNYKHRWLLSLGGRKLRVEKQLTDKNAGPF